jgi:hypothetical protein
MGTWHDALYDDDHALDLLPELTSDIDLDESPAHLAVGIGLRLWMAPESIELCADELRAALARHEGWVADLPERTRAALNEIAADPKSAAGKRVDALFRVPGATAVIQDVADKCIAHLDEATRNEDADLYEIAGDLAPLGVLLEMRAVGVRVPRPKVKAWAAAFKRMDAATDAERGFWDRYAERVKKDLARLSNA